MTEFIMKVFEEVGDTSVIYKSTLIKKFAEVGIPF